MVLATLMHVDRMPPGYPLRAERPCSRAYLAGGDGEGLEMAKQVRDIMTSNPVTLKATDTMVEAARVMRDRNIGDVLVADDDGRIRGVLTDRDIVIRGLAQARDPAHVTLGDVCSRELSTVSPADTIEHAVTLMRERAIRRLPVVENGRPVGIVSLGDLALERDPESALGGISAAPPNR